MITNKIFKLLTFALLLSNSLIIDDVLAQQFSTRSSDFKSIYNNYRARQPKNVPWAGSYWAYESDGISKKLGDQKSPAAEYDAIFGTQAEEWESENHSCKHLKGETKKSCEGWWGHCNAWAAAGIKEPEPTKPIDYKGSKLSVGDQKAWLTEMWMESSTLFTGLTNKTQKTGTWVNQPKSEIAKKPLSFGSGTNYDAFWDVTPRQMFLIFTNHIGILEQGLVIDRFTGDEVWNQPIVGYRILSIESGDIFPPETRDDQELYPVRIQMKIYWANDNVSEEHVSKPFDIKKTEDYDVVEDFYPEYSGRYLTFKLFFDKPLVMEDGKVVSAGKIVGDGVWGHQEDPLTTADELNETHPDFIWAPLDSSHGANYANPYIQESKVRSIIEGVSSGPVETNVTTERADSKKTLQFAAKDFDNDYEVDSIKDKIKFVLDRDGIRNSIYLSGISVDYEARSPQIYVELKIVSGATWERVIKVLAEAGFKAKIYEE